MVFGRHRCKTEMLGHEIWKGLYARRGRTGPAASNGPTQCSRGMKPSHLFKLTKPVNAVAVRIIGKPAGGEEPATAHASCGELEWYAD